MSSNDYKINEVSETTETEGHQPENNVYNEDLYNQQQEAYRSAEREQANKDMLYGALWCVGGIVATVANLGYVFWGAIVFGGIQFFKGLINANR
jgi:hypothetical protein